MTRSDEDELAAMSQHHKSLRENTKLCNLCGFKFQHAITKTVDHIVPRWMGGTSDPTNLQVVCRKCHRAKTRIEQAVRDELRLDPLYGVSGLERQRILALRRLL